jgi:Core-2/I-Branching enzyme
VNLAYIISAYKLPEQLIRLVLKLDSATSEFFIHVDSKTDGASYRRIATALSPLSNVHFLSRHPCYYGGFGHVRATLKGITEISRQGVQFDYVLLLTGQDYPIKSNQSITEFFTQHSSLSFMEYFPMPHAAWDCGGMDRIQSWHFRPRGIHLRFPGRFDVLPKRRFPPLRPFGGSAYWCMTRKCAEFVYEFVRNNPSYMRFFRYVDVPDEIFFQTIILNSPLEPFVVNDDLRFLEWRNPAVAGGPAILKKQDFKKLTNTSKLFARKFDITQDAEILDMIDAVTRDH